MKKIEGKNRNLVGMRWQKIRVWGDDGAPFTPIPKDQSKLISQVMQTLDVVETLLLRNHRYPWTSRRGLPSYPFRFGVQRTPTSFRYPIGNLIQTVSVWRKERRLCLCGSVVAGFCSVRETIVYIHGLNFQFSKAN